MSLIFHEMPQPAVFLGRVNRFVVQVLIEGLVELAHLPNSGRLTSVLEPHRPCWVIRRDGAKRKTRFDLLAIETALGPVVVDAQLPGKLLLAAWKEGAIAELRRFSQVKPEYRLGKSRLDFAFWADEGPPCLVEVKSAADFSRGVARFPDAPSSRARRHLQELEQSLEKGCQASVVLIAQMPWAEEIELNKAIDPEFVAMAEQAAGRGVNFWGFATEVNLPLSISLGRRIPVRLAGRS